MKRRHTTDAESKGDAESSTRTRIVKKKEPG